MNLQQFVVEVFLALFNVLATLVILVWAQLAILVPLVLGIALNVLDQAARSFGFKLSEVAALAIVGFMVYGVLFGKGGSGGGDGKKADHGHGKDHGKAAHPKPAAKAAGGAKKKDDHGHGGGHH